MLPEAQLYHMGARVYNPAIGRFLQTDPILFAGGMNLYAYTANDPVNAIDPSGLDLMSGSNCGGYTDICTILPGSGYSGDPKDPGHPSNASSGAGGSSGSGAGGSGGIGAGGTNGSISGGADEVCPPGVECVTVYGSLAIPWEPDIEELWDAARLLGWRTFGTLGMLLSLTGDTPQKQDQYVVRGGLCTSGSSAQVLA